MNVLYESYNPERMPIWYGDQIMMKKIYEDMGFKTVASLDGLDGAIINLSLHHNQHYMSLLNRDIKKLKWVIIVLTSNESQTDAYKEIKHPNMKIWLQTPKQKDRADFYLPIGYPSKIDLQTTKTKDWFFAGQITNPTRNDCAKVLSKLKGGELKRTEGFSQGFPYEDYLQKMGRAKVVPCPSGPAIPDTFRVYEALELGCIPVVDNGWYWNKLFPHHPLSVVEEWKDFPAMLDFELQNFKQRQTEVQSWWLEYRVNLIDSLNSQIKGLQK